MKEIQENTKASHLHTRGLILQYKKAKEKLLNGDIKSVDFKLRKLKKDAVYQLRINKKF